MRLLVNRIEVPPCACGRDGSHVSALHWAGEDVVAILGRPVLFADAFTVETHDPAEEVPADIAETQAYEDRLRMEVEST
jgi:hypothetical protein